jgi:hypothetical protein
VHAVSPELRLAPLTQSSSFQKCLPPRRAAQLTCNWRYCGRGLLSDERELLLYNAIGADNVDEVDRESHKIADLLQNGPAICDRVNPSMFDHANFDEIFSFYGPAH